MKKAFLLFLVAAIAGVAAFMFAADAFARQAIESRLRELGHKLQHMGEHERTPLNRRWWSKKMPANEDEIPEGKYRPGETFGSREWFARWVLLSEEASGRLEHQIEQFEMGEAVSGAPYDDVTAIPVTWTWYRGVPGEWGERIRMKAVFTYEEDLWKIAWLEEVTAPTQAPPPVVDPK